MEKNEKENKKIMELIKEKKVWVSGLIGIVLGIVILFVFSLLVDFSITRKVKKIQKNTKTLISGIKNDTVAVMDGNSISQEELYNDMKKYYDVSAILDLVDERILGSKYTLTAEQEEEVNEQAAEILEEYYLYYQQSEEEFLSAHKFESKEEFVNYLKLDYRRNLYYLDYLRTVVSKEKIEEYYNSSNIYGDINTKFIFVNSSEREDEEAVKITDDIIARLNNGEAFEDVAKDYEETEVVEELNFNSFNEETIIQAYPEEYINAGKKLEKGAYTKEAVKTEYGYFIIYCIDKKDNPTIEEAEEDILTALSEDLETEDPNLRHKVLIQLRDEANLKFVDAELEREYKEYCEKYN